ncbi:cobalt ECF transporter T component CbiQ [Propionimicrobium lymphophilum]|uniref:cobalt ECF transporter T component CbiQ n=1 Tax=Propionimicrobium lymphophilum TaxID=33012 RepID=UPI0023F10C1A|nr:cobalt ECF transporter T component CbiQ [Propionimicrobium lymphophilum]
MIALDDAAWAAPWRGVSVGQKVLLSLGLVATALTAPVWPTTILVAISAVTLALGFAKIPPRTLALAFTAPFAFILIGSISVGIQLGSSPDNAIWHWWILSISHESIAAGLTVFARSVSATLSVLLLATTTPMVDLLAWFRKLGLPAVLVEVASLTYRLLFVLLDSFLTLHQAQAARLGDAPMGKGARRRQIQNYSTLVGSLMTRSWSRAERLSEGLEARGIDGDLVTLVHQPPLSKKWVFGTLGLIAGIWLVAICFTLI